MKQTLFFIYFFLCFCLFNACNKDEGLGGSSSLEGYIYNVIHYDDNLSFRTETIPAAKEDVYLIFGENKDDYFGKDTEADNNGLFRFNYLRKGTYIIFAYSEFANKKKEAVFQEVKVGNGVSKAEPIYIHTGKAYGTAIVMGKVYTTCHHNGAYRDKGPGTGMRAYIKYPGEFTYFDNARVVDGVFFFQGLFPGTYEIAVETEDIVTEAVSFITKIITITETGKIYEIPEVFEVNTSV